MKKNLIHNIQFNYIIAYEVGQRSIIKANVLGKKIKLAQIKKQWSILSRDLVKVRGNFNGKLCLYYFILLVRDTAPISCLFDQ